MTLLSTPDLAIFGASIATKEPPQKCIPQSGVRGSDDALVLIAELLLNIGLPACDINPGAESGLLDKSYVLEGFLGRQRVSKWSAEAQFHLPNSHSWPGDYPSLS